MTDGAAHLPGLLGVLARAGHGGAALRLAAEWGGTQRYIPARPGADSPLVAIIGLPAAHALAETYGGTHHDIPLAAHLKAKKGAILREPDAGTRDLAQRLGCTERHVREVRASTRPRPDPRQPGLFDSD